MARSRATVLSTVLALLTILGLPATMAVAQSPSPSWKMIDVKTSQTYPTGYNAGVIEGRGMLGANCDYTPYTPSEVETKAVDWIKAGLQTIIEVSPQSSCDGSVSDYESLLASMSSYIKSHVSSSSFTRYWGGFMLDEEPNWWDDTASASYSAYTALNQYAFDHTTYSTPSPYTEVANWSGWWTQSQYNEVTYLSGGYNAPAPQIYTSFMTSEQNSLIASYGAETLVTCDPSGGLSYPYNTCSGAYGTINGAPLRYPEWGSGYWYNVYQNS